MPDESYLDLKYFIDPEVYNCPFCNRRNVVYYLSYVRTFNWTENRTCYVYFVTCNSCNKESMHLSFEAIHEEFQYPYRIKFQSNIDLDSKVFYSVPTSFFVLDDRIPAVIRELITEAEGCIKMNFLTGASACMRKAIYELTVLEKSEGTDYESKIKFLKDKYPGSDPNLFDIIAHIQDMTSDKIHEQSWDHWNSGHLKLFIETLKTILHDIYVDPKIKNERSAFIQKLFKQVSLDRKEKRKETL
jgi:hypothetical protein